MKRLIRNIINLLHVHYYGKPIVSMYSGFNTRNIIWQCKCGKRIKEREFMPHTEFSIKTTNFITRKEFDEILNGAPLSNYPLLKFYSNEKSI